MNSLPKIVTRQSQDCDLNPGPSAPESSQSNHSARRLPSHPVYGRSYISSVGYLFSNTSPVGEVVTGDLLRYAFVLG